MKFSFGSIFSGIVSVLSNAPKADTAKAEQVAGKVGAIVEFALPVVQFFTTLTANKVDDAAIVLLRKFLTPVQAGAATAAKAAGTPVSKSDQVRWAAQNAIKNDLKGAITAAGSAGLKIGAEVVKTPTAIPDSRVNLAIEMAHQILKEKVVPVTQ